MDTTAGGVTGPSRMVFLEEKHMLSILLFLMDNDGCIKSQFYESISCGIRMPEKLDKLEDAGLIVQDYGGPYRSVRIRLTELWRGVCRELAVIDGMLVGRDSI